MITSADLTNPRRSSGYDRVATHPSWTTKDGVPRYRFQINRTHEGEKNIYGPNRATAEEAAQDYCDHINGGAVTPTRPGKVVTHRSRRPSFPDVAATRAAQSLDRYLEKRRTGKGYVYLVAESGQSPAVLSHREPQYVKVGFSIDPPARTGELQCGNPRPLRLLATLEGTEADERALHERFAANRAMGEWFSGDAVGQLITHFNAWEAVNQ